MSTYLSPESLEAVLPNYNSIFDTVRNIRTEASKLEKINKEDWDHLPYKNVISILGERGSGKTTVFNTLRDMIKNPQQYKLSINETEDSEKGKRKKERNNMILEELNHINDIHLRPIVPEVLEESTDILGIILLNVQTLMEEKKDIIADYYRKNIEEQKGLHSCCYAQSNPLVYKWEEVFTTYLQRAEGFSEIVKENYTSLNDYSKERQKTLKAEVQLGKQIFDLFTELVKAFSKGQVSPLIFIYIDDADINRERCAESVRTILRYLKHPNVAVFISGDIDKFNEVLLVNELLEEKSSRIRMILPKEEIKETKEIYIYELLKKVMPYSNRYHLIKLTNKQKRNFIYPGSKDNQTFEELIEEFIKEIKKDFHTNNKIPESVYSIFDYKPRGIISIWDYIKNNFLNVQTSSNNVGWLKYHYLNLFTNIIHMNERMNAYSELIVEEVLTFIETNEEIESNRNIISVQINHERFKNIIIGQLDKEKNPNLLKKVKEEYIVIINMIYFVELIFNKDTIKGQIYSELLNLILQCPVDKEIYFEMVNATDIFELYGELSRVLTLEQQSQIYSNKIYFKIYTKILTKYMDKCIDYQWKEKYEQIAREIGKDNIIKHIMEVFEGVAYDQDLLNPSRNIMELDCNQDLNFDLDGIIETIIQQVRGKAIVDYFLIDQEQYGTHEDIIEFLQEYFEKSIIKNRGIERNIKETFKYLNPEIYLPRKDYRTIKRYLDNISDEEENGEVNNTILLINNTKVILKKMINKQLSVNKKTCTNIINQIEGKVSTVYVDFKIKKHKEDILGYIGQQLKVGEAGQKCLECIKVLLEEDKYLEVSRGEIEHIVHKDNLVWDEEDEELVEDGNYLVWDEEDEELVEDGNYLLWSMRYNDGKEESKGWHNRRRSTLNSINNIIILIIKYCKCEEYLDDFIFINQDELGKNGICLDFANILDMHINVSYEPIDKYYYNLPHRNIDIDSIYKEIQEVKQKIIGTEEAYQMGDIDIQQLQLLMQETTDRHLQQEIQSMKQDLEWGYKISRKKWDSFSEKLEKYVNTLQEDKFYMAKITNIKQHLLIQKEVIKHNTLIKDIVKEENQKILQIRYENLILVLKYILAKNKGVQGYVKALN